MIVANCPAPGARRRETKHRRGAPQSSRKPTAGGEDGCPPRRAPPSERGREPPLPDVRLGGRQPLWRATPISCRDRAASKSERRLAPRSRSHRQTPTQKSLFTDKKKIADRQRRGGGGGARVETYAATVSGKHRRQWITGTGWQTMRKCVLDATRLSHIEGAGARPSKKDLLQSKIRSSHLYRYMYSLSKISPNLLSITSCSPRYLTLVLHVTYS